MHSEASLCKNCAHVLTGHFCSHCGQKADIHRITWHEIAHQFPHAVFHVDGGMFYTIGQLASRPGHGVREYLMGKRKPHYNPFLLLLMSAGLCSILFAWFHIPTVFANVRLDRVEEQSATLAHKFFAIRLAFFCVLFSVGDFLLFRREGYYFPEIVIFNCFAFCGVSIIQLLFVPWLVLGMKTGTLVWWHTIMLVAVFAYLWWMRWQFLEAGRHPVYRWLIPLSLLLYLLSVAFIGSKIVQPLLWQ